MYSSLFSNLFTVSITSNCCLAQEGQETMVTPLFLKCNDFSISYPTLTSSIGSSDKETLIVSPIPSYNKNPKPIEDFIEPENFDIDDYLEKEINLCEF